jgi:aldose 1-epimerase
MSALTSVLSGGRGEQAAGEYEIHHGDYAAVITTRAGALRRLTYRGRDLVVPSPFAGPIPDYRGIIAAPWPNRIADGCYRFDGQLLHVPINERDRQCSLHGLAFDREWSVLCLSDLSVTLALELEPSEGYPFALVLETTYTLDADRPDRGGGLRWEVRARNVGDRTAPYGVCPHPYLVAGESPLDEWELQIPAARFLEVTHDRLLPMGERDVVGHEFDFRTARPIGTTKIDHAFTGIDFGPDGTASLALRDPVHGTGVRMEWDRGCSWLQIHTADKRPPAPSRLGLAVEPMTCPPDAFNSGSHLIRLAPGTSHTARWRICSLDQHRDD